jgi:hypothetical protein
MSTTCQICGRAIKASKGTIAHHGYQRPGHGWQTASCFGAKWRPYEVASDALPPAIASLEHYIADTELAHLAHTYEMPAVLRVRSTRFDAYGRMVEIARPAGFNPDRRFGPDGSSHVAYHDAYRRLRSELESSIRSAKADLVLMRQRLADWRPA